MNMYLTWFLSFSSLFLVSNICFSLLIFSVDFCQGFRFSDSKSHCYVPLKLWILVLAFRDIAPQAPTHVLIIPKSKDGLSVIGFLQWLFFLYFLRWPCYV
ncbi:hypothetical protein ES288_A11G396100v1 [Gossypium darwinii]|uniref:HIT domain-containing protein n=2 Tax=Gossypium TaxID=3633 RepID=A0A5D2BH24_GOSDA|nr:hypothetical protein ES288_D08G000600v1 [Gossypium darwinii]TYG96968.1 hypothetical protein ES288_A11G396100v1 [Gossypium darwinii]TYH56188.1 hypothetical protein ES332_D08G000700v1 [Gossypium tomentosum]